MVLILGSALSNEPCNCLVSVILYLSSYFITKICRRTGPKVLLFSIYAVVAFIYTCPLTQLEWISDVYTLSLYGRFWTIFKNAHVFDSCVEVAFGITEAIFRSYTIQHILPIGLPQLLINTMTTSLFLQKNFV